MLAIITLASIAMIFYACFGYMACLFILPSRNSNINPLDENSSPILPKSFSLIATVYNEQHSIEKKILDSLEILTNYRKCLEENYKQVDADKILENTELIIASDASDDGTEEIVKSFKDKGVLLVRIDERGGKEKAQKFATSTAKGEIVLFTDVRAELDKDILKKLNTYFHSKQIGAVSTKDVILESDGKISGESFYVKYEMKLRELESNFNTLVGLSGSGFAVRKTIALEMKENIPSDFSLLLEARKQGFIGVQARDIQCCYSSLKVEEEEFARKVRTVLRGMTAFFQVFEIDFIKEDFPFAWQLLSHKLARWLVPWFMIISLLGIFILSFTSSFWSLMLILAFVFHIFAFVGVFGKKEWKIRDHPVIKIPSYFTLTNTATLTSWLKYFSGERNSSWSPSKRA